MDIAPIDLINALADTTRLRILALLSRHRELCVCELVDALDAHQPKVSKHLAVLRRARILRGRREGQWIHYRIDPEMPAWARRLIDELADGCEPRQEFQADAHRLAAREARHCKAS